MTETAALSTPVLSALPKPSRVIERLAEIPDEEIWLAKQKSACTRRAYRLDVRHFMAMLAITSHAELRHVDHRTVIAWERAMRETERAAPSTVRRRLSALSVSFKHLVRHGLAARNWMREIERSAISHHRITSRIIR